MGNDGTTTATVAAADGPATSTVEVKTTTIQTAAATTVGAMTTSTEPTAATGGAMTTSAEPATTAETTSTTEAATTADPTTVAQPVTTTDGAPVTLDPSFEEYAVASSFFYRFYNTEKTFYGASDFCKDLDGVNYRLAEMRNLTEVGLFQQILSMPANFFTGFDLVVGLPCS